MLKTLPITLKLFHDTMSEEHRHPLDDLHPQDKENAIRWICPYPLPKEPMKTTADWTENMMNLVEMIYAILISFDYGCGSNGRISRFDPTGDHYCSGLWYSPRYQYFSCCDEAHFNEEDENPYLRWRRVEPKDVAERIWEDTSLNPIYTQFLKDQKSFFVTIIENWFDKIVKDAQFYYQPNSVTYEALEAEYTKLYELHEKKSLAYQGLVKSGIPPEIADKIIGFM